QMGKVERVAQVVLRVGAADRAQKLAHTVAIDGPQANSWSIWSFPTGARLDSAPATVHSTLKWAGIKRLYPFVQEGAPPAGSDGLLVTSMLAAASLAHLRSGGRVWLMAERGTTRARQEVGFFPAAGGALGTLVRDHPALQEFPHD